MVNIPLTKCFCFRNIRKEVRKVGFTRLHRLYPISIKVKERVQNAKKYPLGRHQIQAMKQKSEAKSGHSHIPAQQTLSKAFPIYIYNMYLGAVCKSHCKFSNLIKVPENSCLLNRDGC